MPLTRLLFGCAVLTLVALSGCVTERTGSARNNLYGTDLISKQNSDGTRSLNPERVLDPNPRIVIRNNALKTELIPLGTIEFDLQTFPLVSPRGQYLATEVGIPPTIETIRAEIGASVPTETFIEIHRIIPADGEGGTPRIELVTRLEGNYLLGRSCNDQGFLVEAPQPDGARWIGFAAWEDGEIIWIVDDEYVNAFGVLGPRGRLAWSRRAVDEEQFQLVVMTRGDPFSFGGSGVSWMYPTWTQDGFGLFAVTVSPEHQLDAVFMRGETKAAMLQSRRSIVLSKRGDADAAYRMHAPSPVSMGLPAGARPSLVFYHPEWRRMCVWRPLRNDSRQAMRLDDGAVAGVMDDKDFIVFTLRNTVVGQPLEQPDMRSVLAPAGYLPRLTASHHWRYVMFLPSATSATTLQVVGMNIIEESR